MWSVSGSARLWINIKLPVGRLLCIDKVRAGYVRVWSGEAEIKIADCPELLALRKELLAGNCNPAVIADWLEERRESWIEERGAEEVLKALRECW